MLISISTTNLVLFPDQLMPLRLPQCLPIPVSPESMDLGLRSLFSSVYLFLHCLFVCFFISYTIWLTRLPCKKGPNGNRIFLHIILRKLKYKHLANNAFMLLCVFRMHRTGPATNHIHSKNTISVTWKWLCLLKSSSEILFHLNLNNITSTELHPFSFTSFSWHLLYLP